MYLNDIGMSKVTLPPQLFEVLFHEHVHPELNELGSNVQIGV